ncbi:zinc-finger domain-containing protein [Phanerochaete sordida]|uniref:Zinc-finger domain-containing protein n=1 Tax=Phanerochaete sordida TaxID=48140 RepID=A0A9P3G1U4_9APHY|nr:zinc-finger domain-containing protein [Phanerochaete sordida]
MLSRHAVVRLARPLARLSSGSSVAIPPVEPKQVAPQAPNYPTTWSTSQAPRPAGQSGPRFEQTIMELQPNPPSAMQMVAEEPIRVVHGRKAVCDGGVGPLGHPKIFINLDKPGPQPCGYCGIRYEQAPHHAHEH